MRLVSSLCALVVIVAACSSSNAECVAIVDDAIGVFQELISTVDELDLAETAAAGDGVVIPGLAEIEARADALQVEADGAGCSDETLRELLTERIVRLEARTVFGQAVIEGIRQEGLFGGSPAGGTP